MIAIVSPAKTLDYSVSVPKVKTTLPRFMNEAEKLVTVLKKKKPAEIEKLMGVSKDLARLNHQRFQSWKKEAFAQEAKPAALVFRGDVYRGLDVDSLAAKELNYAQEHVRILSGLYGLLNPLDKILPYRLEMGTSLKVSASHKNLYAYWGDKITDQLNEDSAGKELINLASNEYFKAVNPKVFTGRIITPVFKEFKNGKYSTVMTYAKLARGKMARYMIQNKLNTPEKLKAYSVDGYEFSDELSDRNTWTFVR